MKIASVGKRTYQEIEFDGLEFKSSKFRRFSDGVWEEYSYSSDCVGHWAVLAEPELFEQAYQEWKGFVQLVRIIKKEHRLSLKK